MIESPLRTTVLFHIGFVPIGSTVVTTWGLMAAMKIGCWVATRDLRIVAGGPQAVMETIILAIEEQTASILSRPAGPFLPLLGTLFIFLVFANLCGIVPGVSAPTASLETPA